MGQQNAQAKKVNCTGDLLSGFQHYKCLHTLISKISSYPLLSLHSVNNSEKKKKLAENLPVSNKPLKCDFVGN